VLAVVGIPLPLPAPTRAVVGAVEGRCVVSLGVFGFEAALEYHPAGDKNRNSIEILNSYSFLTTAAGEMKMQNFKRFKH
jgi:hypothetical protein